MLHSMRVLVVEDHRRLAAALADGLRREGMAIDLALDGADALARIAVNSYDVVVLDRDIPGVHGDQVCRTLAAEPSQTRVLMLTAASTIRDRVDGLGLGADDYLPKPFDFAELVARIRALARRATAPLPPTWTTVTSVSIRCGGRRCAGSDGSTLSPKEFAVLEYLLAADGRVVSAEELLTRVWDEAANPFTTTVKTTIGRLRGEARRPAHDRDRPRGRLPDLTCGCRWHSPPGCICPSARRGCGLRCCTQGCSWRWGRR